VRTHRRRPSALALAAAAALFGALPAAAAAKAPRAVVQSALAPLLAGSYRATFTSAVTTSFANVQPPQLAAALPAQPAVRSGGRAAVESRRRTLTTQSASGSTVAVVDYDGQIYVSTDGRTYRRAVGALRSTLAALEGQGSSGLVKSLLAHAGGLHAAGTVRQGGVLARRYRGTLDPAFLRGLLARTALAARLPTDIVAAIASTSQLGASSVDFLVTPAGRLVGVDRSEQTSMDMVPLLRARGTAVPDGVAGTIVVTSAFSMRLAGGVVHVNRPRAAGTVSTLVQSP